MIQPRRESDAVEQPTRPVDGIRRCSTMRDRWDQHVFEHRTLRQQVVILEHEPDRRIAEPRERRLVEVLAQGGALHQRQHHEEHDDRQHAGQERIGILPFGLGCRGQDERELEKARKIQGEREKQREQQRDDEQPRWCRPTYWRVPT